MRKTVDGEGPVQTVVVRSGREESCEELSLVTKGSGGEGRDSTPEHRLDKRVDRDIGVSDDSKVNLMSSGEVLV